MLMCFLKDKDEQAVKCEIVAFCDRLWLNDEEGIDCIRLFLIHNRDTEKTLSRVRMIVPYKNLLEIKDVSEKFLDKQWAFTQGSTGGYQFGEYDPIRKSGVATIDGFQNVKVFTNNVVTTTHLSPKDFSLVEIKNLDNPVKPNEIRLVAVSFSVSSLLDQMFGKESDTFSLSINYLEKCEQTLNNLVGNRDLEIPIKKIYDSVTNQGGFDIFLYLPPLLAGQDFNFNTRSESTVQFDGTDGAKRQKFLWRGRLQFSDARIEYLKPGKQIFEIHGYIYNPHRIRTIEKKLQEIFKSLKKDKKWFWISFIASIIALVKAFWPDIIVFLSKFCKIK